MKKIILLSIGVLLLLNVTNCKKPDNVIYDVLDNASQGAVLRTLERVSTVFNLFDHDSTFEVKLEEQDVKKGELLDKVNVYVSFIDRTDDGVDNSVSEKLLKTISKSEFATSDKGLPMTSHSTKFSEALTALGLDPGEYFGGDIFKFRFELVLTDGSTYSEESTSGTLQQSFFDSPFAYYVKIVCIPTSPIDGDYRVDLHDSYGDGWQGSKIIVTIDGVAKELALPDFWTCGCGGSVGDAMYVAETVTVTVPSGTTSLKWEWSSGAYPSEASFEIYGPHSGVVIYQGGPSEPDGELFLNYCNE